MQRQCRKRIIVISIITDQMSKIAKTINKLQIVIRRARPKHQGRARRHFYQRLEAVLIGELPSPV